MGSGRKISLAVGVVIVASLAMVAIAQGGSPPTPHLFYGTVKVSGVDAPVGTLVSAEVGGVLQDTVTVSTAGSYGGPGAEDEKLVVSDPGTVLFYISGSLANETSTFSSGAVTELALTASVAQVDVTLAAGFNLIGIPVGISATTTALDLWKLMDAQGIKVKSISGWAVFGSQVFTTWDPLFPGTSNIPIELGRGYFVDIAQSATFSITGPPLGASVCLNLVPGFNLVSVPFQTPAGGYGTVNFGQLITDAGGSLRSISGWAVFGSQVFTTWDPLFPGTSSFDIDNISGIFVDMGGPATVNP